MTRTESMIMELEIEAESTRRLIERIPEAKLSWRPHPKSDSLGSLALHLALLPRGIADLVSETDREIPDVPRPEGTSVKEILAALDANVTYAKEKLRSWGDEGLAVAWRLRSGGETLIEQPRGGVIRFVMLNHSYHHRGQLSVYLRLLDVPLPAIYGPSADEVAFGRGEREESGS